MTTDGQNNLIIDDGVSDRILGFGTEEMVASLCDATTVQGRG